MGEEPWGPWQYEGLTLSEEVVGYAVKGWLVSLTRRLCSLLRITRFALQPWLCICLLSSLSRSPTDSSIFDQTGRVSSGQPAHGLKLSLRRSSTRSARRITPTRANSTIRTSWRVIWIDSFEDWTPDLGTNSGAICASLPDLCLMSISVRSY